MRFTCLTSPECINYDCEHHMAGANASDVNLPVDMEFYKHCVLFTSDPATYESSDYQARKADVEAGNLTLWGESVNGA